MGRLLRRDILLLLGVLVVVAFTYGGIRLQELFIVRGALAFDEWALLLLRDPAAGYEVVGPYWLAEAVRDITALGGPAVLALITASVVVFLVMQGSHRAAGVVVLATVGGLLVSLGLKELFMRPRPDIVPQLMVETSPGFPSGHSMMSAVVYLTLGSLLARLEPDGRVRLFLVCVVLFLTFLVGASRVALGVHYATDVIAGWAVGLFWASFCWFVMMACQRKGTVEPCVGEPVGERAG